MLQTLLFATNPKCTTMCNIILVSCLIADMRKRASMRAVLTEILSNCGNDIPTLPLYSKAKVRKFILNNQIKATDHNLTV